MDIENKIKCTKLRMIQVICWDMKEILKNWIALDLAGQATKDSS